MLYLLAASLLWAFSFGLIKGRLAGLDPVAVSSVRLVLAVLAFLPFWVRSESSTAIRFRAMGLGAVQFGLMYMLYIAAYGYLPAWLVALFTIFTPLYVTLLGDLMARRFVLRHLAAALLAIVGAGWITMKGLPEGASWQGVVLLQVANLCFAVGQLGYPALVQKARDGNRTASESGILGWMYLGAAILACGVLGLRLPAAFENEAWRLGNTWIVLLYLGLLPTAAGFYLWNKGAARTGRGFLAVANNLKVPLAVLLAWTVFGEAAAYGRALVGLAVIVAALFLARGRSPSRV